MDITHPLLIMDYFNEIINVEERRGQSREILSIRKFESWIDTLNLIDIPMNERKYTLRKEGIQEVSWIDFCLAVHG